MGKIKGLVVLAMAAVIGMNFGALAGIAFAMVAAVPLLPFLQSVKLGVKSGPITPDVDQTVTDVTTAVAGVSIPQSNLGGVIQGILDASNDELIVVVEIPTSGLRVVTAVKSEAAGTRPTDADSIRFIPDAAGRSASFTAAIGADNGITTSAEVAAVVATAKPSMSVASLASKIEDAVMKSADPQNIAIVVDQSDGDVGSVRVIQMASAAAVLGSAAGADVVCKVNQDPTATQAPEPKLAFE